MVVQPLHSSFVLRPATRSQELQLVYTRRELPVRRLYSSSSSSDDDHDDEEDDKDDEEAETKAAPVLPLQPPLSVLPPAACTVKSSLSPTDDSSFRPTKRSRTTVLPWNKAIHTIPNLQSEFEPPSDPQYWKQRCFHWQSICQTTRQKLREMEEDQRQLRKRLWQLEEQVVWTASRNKSIPRVAQLNNICNSTNNNDGSKKNNNKQVPISPTSEDRRPPTWIVTIPPRKCSFYLTDSEGLSDSEYVDDELEDYDDIEEDGKEEGDFRDDAEMEESESPDEERDSKQSNRLDEKEETKAASEKSDSKRTDDAVFTSNNHKNSHHQHLHYHKEDVTPNQQQKIHGK